MIVKSNIKILCGSNLSTEEHIQLSTGIRSEKDKKQENSEYADFVLVPTSEWISPNEEILFDLIGNVNNEYEYGSWIGLMRFPDEVLYPLRTISTTYSTTPQALNDPQYRPGLISILKYLRPMYEKLDDLEVHNIAFKPAGLLTSTYDDRRKCYIGLHLDSWEQKPFGETHLARTRICINLGSEPRYFLFYNLSLEKMFEALGISLDELRELYPRNSLGQSVGYEFMKRHSSYPVTRLKILPGEAYLAPTENIFHDGSTIDQSTIDVSLTIRGFFRRML